MLARNRTEAYTDGCKKRGRFAASGGIREKGELPESGGRGGKWTPACAK